MRLFLNTFPARNKEQNPNHAGRKGGDEEGNQAMKKASHNEAGDEEQNSANFFVLPSDGGDDNQDETGNEMRRERHGPIRFRKNIQRKDTNESDKNNRQGARQPIKKFLHIHIQYYTTK